MQTYNNKLLVNFYANTLKNKYLHDFLKYAISKRYLINSDFLYNDKCIITNLFK
jgi:hypothetical protein